MVTESDLPPPQFYYRLNGLLRGPMSGRQLKQLAASGQLSPSDLVWIDPTGKGVPASEIKGLFPGSVPRESAVPKPANPEKSPLGTRSRQLVAVVQRRLFLSCVSLEFRAYRDLLAANLAQPGIELRRQEDFVNAGQTTLEKLDDYIFSCDAVIHLVGHATGAYPEPAEVETLLARLPDFAATLRLTNVFPSPGLSYTQWEAWLALYHKKPLALYRASEAAQREVGFRRDQEQERQQQQHWHRLEKLGRDRKEFTSPFDLSIEVLRAIPLMVPGFAENVRRGEFRDRNLLFAVLAMQDEILSREAFLRVCTLWAGNTDQSISDIMERERLLSSEDRHLIEARLERKLKSHQGDVRQSLAESLGSDIRMTLGDALSPDVFVSLPDRLAAMGNLEAHPGKWRYRLTRTHGSGGLGVVSVAEDSALERSVAVKQLRTERMLDPMAVERFVREARITGRLQHPNIVPVYELGLRPDDQVPFYAMRFVGHRTMQDAITQHYANKTASAGDRNISFRSLLQAFLSVCNAVAFAHDQGVIHRDLKPVNVMIGDFGEVILLDWGLAKRIDEVEPAALVTHADANAMVPDAGQTQAGARLGSPAYMAPEQASGRIDLHGPHTDIYGLGVTLYEILTGDVPFTGSTTDELLYAIQSRALPDPCVRNPAIPKALAAICRKALEKEPKRRYLTAKALADDIQHWLADEPVSVFAEPIVMRAQRVARKNPGPFSAVAATIFVGIVGLSLGLYFVNVEKNQKKIAFDEKSKALQQAEYERNKALVARSDAEKSFTQARKTVDEFVVEISREELSVIPGVQELRQKLAKRAVNRYEQFAADHPEDWDVRAGLADATISLGQVVGGIGSVDQAAKEMRHGISLLEEGIHLKSSAKNRLRLAKARLELGGMYWEIGQFADAMPLAELCVRELDELLVEKPDDVDVRFELARSLSLRGKCRPTLEDRTADMLDLERSRALMVEILDLHPKKPDCFAGIAAACHNLALIYKNQKDYLNAMALLDESADLDQKVLALTPNAPRAVSNASLGHCERGSILKLMGQRSEAAETYAAAVQASRRVVNDNPKVSRYQWLLAYTLKERAAFLAGNDNQSDMHRSESLYEESSQILEELVLQVDDRPQYAEELIKNRLAQAEFFQGTSGENKKQDNVQRRECVERAIDAGKWLSVKFPRSSRVNYEFARSYFQLGLLEENTNHRKAAMDDYGRAIKIYCDSLAMKGSRSEPYQIDGLLSWISSAETHAAKLGRTDEFLNWISLGEQLGSDCPLREVRQRLAGLLHNRATIQKKAGRDRDAIDSYNASLSVARPAWEKATWHWYLRQSVAGAYLNLAELHQRTGNLSEEIHARQEWLRIWGGPMTSHKTEGLIELGLRPNQELAEKLRKEMSISKSMKKFTVPCDFGGLKYPFDVYITEMPWPTDPLEDQAKYLEEQHGGVIPKDVRESFRKLHELAHKNNVSLPELCVYALNVAAKDEPEKRLNEVLERLQRSADDYAAFKNGDNGLDFAQTYAEVGEVRIVLGDYRQAELEFKKGIAVLDELIEKGLSIEASKEKKQKLESRASYCKLYRIATGDMETILGNDRDVLPTLFQVRASEFAKRGKMPEVEQAAEMLRKLKPREKIALYNAACAYSLCATLVVKDKPDPTNAERAQRQKYLDLSLACLKEAIALGYDNFAQMRTDNDLTPLRDLSEFMALIPAEQTKSSQKK